MSAGKTKRAGVFEALVAAVESDGPLDVGVLATSSLPIVSARAKRAAQHLVGVVSGDETRVRRLAELLDGLRAADARHAGKRRDAS